MKKWQWGILFIISFYCSSVKAQSFYFEKNDKYQYQLIWKIGVNSSQNIYSNMYKITDKEGNVFYDVQPKSTIFTSQSYNLLENPFGEEESKKMARIMHFGYEYENHQTLEYYVATQYLLFKLLGVDRIKILDQEGKETTFAQKEIAEIQELVENHRFVPEDYTISDKNLKIENPYIMRYYDIEENGFVSKKENNSYIINFSEEQEKYIVPLKAKKNCLNVEYWKSSTSADVIGKGDLCEEDTSFTVLLKKEEIKEEDISNEEPQIEAEKIPIDEIEVNMPNTAKYNCIGLIFLVMLGNIYYVYKK